MTLLLDSHALLWAIYAPHKLAPGARRAVEDGNNAVFFSTASLWELAIKCAKGTLEIEDGFIEAINAAGLVELIIRPQHAWAVKSLLRLHGDPFDRMLVAQASQERMTLVTRDRFLGGYSVNILEA